MLLDYCSDAEQEQNSSTYACILQKWLIPQGLKWQM